MGFHIETKTIGALNRVSHKTLESESGGLAEDFKLEYKPDFKPFGRTTLWTLAGNHTSLLNGPKSLSAVSIAAKTSITDKSTITAKLPLDKKKPSLALKFETGEYKSIRNWVNGTSPLTAPCLGKIAYVSAGSQARDRISCRPCGTNADEAALLARCCSSTAAHSPNRFRNLL